MRHIALPKPGDWRQLCIQVARLHARPMGLAIPLWEFTIVEGLDNIAGLPPGCFALVSKVHHAAIDGMSGVEMSAAVHELTPAMTLPDRADTWKPDMPALADLLARSYLHNLVQPMRIVETIGRSLPGVARLGLQLGKSELPKDTLIAMAPISVCGDGEKEALGNLVSAMVAGPGTNIADPVERLRHIHQERSIRRACRRGRRAQPR